jgi:outer membrane immunogenic protein
MATISGRAGVSGACLIAAALLAGGPAAAADRVFDGLYGGAFANYTKHTVDAIQAGVPVGTASTDGAGFGAILGLAIPITQNWYAGVEGDFSWDDRAVRLGSTDYILSHWGTLRGRIGYTITPSLMLFASAGVALADFDFKDFLTPVPSRGSEHIWGYAASAGVDFALVGTVRLRAEYMYSSFENWGFSTPIRHSEDSDAHIVRLGAIVRLW